jgi:hypothetical protein
MDSSDDASIPDFPTSDERSDTPSVGEELLGIHIDSSENEEPKEPTEDEAAIIVGGSEPDDDSEDDEDDDDVWSKMVTNAAKPSDALVVPFL